MKTDVGARQGPQWGTSDAEIKDPLVEAQGYQGFPLSKPAVGQNIALDAVPAYGASSSIPTWFLP